MKKIIILLIIVCYYKSFSQDYEALIADGNYKVSYISEIAERHFDTVGRGKGTGYTQFKRWEYNAIRLQDENEFLKSPLEDYEELQHFNTKQNKTNLGKKLNNSNWQQLGPDYYNQTSGWNPGVGRITSIAIDPANDNHIIVGAVQGGVWKTTDGGTNWTVLTDNLSNIYVNSLAMDPTNSNTYFWGSTGGIVFKSTDGGSTWNRIKSLPNGGNVNKILIHPGNTNIMYATSELRGIYKTTDGGNSWSRIHPNATNGFDVEFKPNDYNTVYATGKDFYVSRDGGITFNEYLAPAPLPIIWTEEFTNGSLNWRFTSSNQNETITAKTGSKLARFYYNSTNGFETKLITPALDLSTASSPELKFSYSNVNWFTRIDELKVYYKTSLAGIWTELAHYTTAKTTWEDVTLALPNGSSDYYIAFEGIVRFGRGITLDDISIEDPTLGVVFQDGFETSGVDYELSTGAKMIAVSPDNPDVVYVLEEKMGRFGGLYKSTDSGAIFTKFDHGKDNYFGYEIDASDDRGQAPRDMDIVVNPENVNDVHIAGILSWRSTDGGYNLKVTSEWIPRNATNQNIGYCHADIDILIYQGGRLFVGTDGGIFVANNPTIVNRAYYTDLSVGLGIRQFYKIGVSQTNPVVITGGSQDNGTSVYRTDGTWADWLGADGMETFVDKTNPQILYGTSQNGSLYRSSNGGNSYNWLSTPENKEGAWVTPFEQDPIAQDVIYSAYNIVYKSSNKGSNWTAISQDFGGNMNQLKIAPSNNLVLYVSRGRNLYKTTDGGDTDWALQQTFAGNINYISVHPTDPNKVAVVTTDSGRVHISVDGGANWTNARYNLPGFAALALTWDITYSEDILYLGMNYGIYYLRHSKGETTWQTFSNNMPNVQINELEINTSENKIYAGTYGRGLWVNNLFSPITLGTSSFTVDVFKMHPNPASSQVTIQLKGVSGEADLRIFDVQGKIVHYSKDINASNILTINTSLYAKGIYFVKMDTQYGEITKKLIVK